MTKELLKLALEALEIEQAIYRGDREDGTPEHILEAITAIKEALAQPEPVAVHQFRKRGCSDWYDGNPDHTDGCGPYEARTLYTSTPARHGWTTQQIAGMARLKEAQDKKLSPRTWVGLTDEEKADLFEGTAPYYNEADYADAIEAKLKEKNTP